MGSGGVHFLLFWVIGSDYAVISDIGDLFGGAVGI